MAFDLKTSRTADGQVPGSSRIIHFYFSRAQRQRFAHFLTQGLAACEDVVLACPRDNLQVFGSAVEKGSRSGNLTYVEVPCRPQSAVSSLLASVLGCSRLHSRVRLLADFGEVRESASIAEIEFLLNSGLEGLSVPCVTQYDGKAVAGPLRVDLLRPHGLVLFDDFLYRGSSRRKNLPEEDKVAAGYSARSEVPA